MEKRCAICRCDTGNNTLLYGDWMTKAEITVHYNCLLLSTNLPQRGEDNSGILGFLLRDIRREVVKAASRKCVYCKNIGASISCHKCHVYFHLECGVLNLCLFTFYGFFYSYCNNCIPFTKHQKVARRNWKGTEICHICKDKLGRYSPIEYLYAACCGQGYVHRLCMQHYALAAGYYLRCLWCRDQSFRESIRSQGIFVPDRDAKWEREKGAFRDLHRSQKRCDVERCLCERGRQFESVKWKLICCRLCGSFGIHNPICLSAVSKSYLINASNFVCETCLVIEKSLEMRRQNKDSQDSSFELAKQSSNDNETLQQGAQVSSEINDMTLYMQKEFKSIVIQESCAKSNTLITFSDDEIMQQTQNNDTDPNEGKIENKPNERNLNLDAIPLPSNAPNNSFLEFEVYEYDDSFNVKGRNKIRINLMDPRVKDRQSNYEIVNLITEKDIIERSNDRGVFALIDDILAEF